MIMERAELKQLKLTALRCRQNVLRMIRANHSGHLGPAYSCLDIVTALYFHVMNVDPAHPEDPDRDRFLVSAGHKGMAQYAALAERGYFPKDYLDKFGHCPLPGHPDMHMLPGIEASTGSLGHGLNLAVGMALAMKQDGRSSRVFVVTGDGELAEGSNWEAIAVAAHYNLDNLVVIVDHNGLQISGHTWEVMSFEPVAAHFAGFGWNTIEIDGNDMAAVVDAFDNQLPKMKGKPTVIVANDVKAKGYSKLEGLVGCHYWAPTPEGMAEAEQELANAIEEVEGE